MALVLDMDAEDVGAVGMAAAAWLMGLPVDRSRGNVRLLASQIETLLGHLTNEDTGQPLRLVDGWWHPATPEATP